MEIYVLTKTDTQKSFSPIDVLTFVSHEQAQNEMITQFHSYLKSVGVNIPIEQLNSPNGYEGGDISVGFDYARDDAGMVIWEIFTTEVKTREIIISNIINYVGQKFCLPKRFDGVLYRLISEYKDDVILSVTNYDEFIDEHLIGEALYENVLEQLGGKNGDYYYGVICDYLDSSDAFIDGRCSTIDYPDMPKKIDKMDDWQKWFLGMLVLCSGDKTMLNYVRKDIDDKRTDGDKIFEIEKFKDIVKENGGKLPENHRNMCSNISDEQYYELMSKILTNKFEVKYGSDFLDKISNIYEAMTYVVYTIINARGTNAILDDYSYVIELLDHPKFGWYIAFIGDPYEVATAIDDLKSRNKELF